MQVAQFLSAPTTPWSRRFWLAAYNPHNNMRALPASLSPAARSALAAALPDVQHALANEHPLLGWAHAVQDGMVFMAETHRGKIACELVAHLHKAPQCQANAVRAMCVDVSDGLHLDIKPLGGLHGDVPVAVAHIPRLCSVSVEVVLSHHVEQQGAARRNHTIERVCKLLQLPQVKRVALTLRMTDSAPEEAQLRLMRSQLLPAAGTRLQHLALDTSDARLHMHEIVVTLYNPALLGLTRIELDLPNSIPPDTFDLAEALEDLPALRSVDIKSALAPETLLQLLPERLRLPRLERIKFEQCVVGPHMDDEIGAFLAKHTALQEVVLESWQAEDQVDPMAFGNPQDLMVAMNEATPMPLCVKRLKLSAQLTRLEICSGCRMTGQEAEGIAEVINTLSQLQTLSLAGAVVSAHAFLAHLRTPAVTQLDMRHVQVALDDVRPPPGSDPTAFLARCRQLRRWDISNCNIEPGLCRRLLGAVSQLTLLTSLDAHAVQGDAPHEALGAQLQALLALRQLRLDKCHFSERACAVLAQSLPQLQALTCLNLAHAALPDAGAAGLLTALAALTGLQQL